MEFILADNLISIINMSITGSYVILAILAARMLLRRTPKIFSYLLWSVAGFRLLCPFSFSSEFSLQRIISEWFDGEKLTMEGGIIHYIPANIGYMKQPIITTGVTSLSHAINNYLPQATPYSSINPIQLYSFLAAYLWIMGIILFTLYSLGTYIRLKYLLRKAVLVDSTLYESDRVYSPFVLGIIKPKIYIPFHLNKSEQEYVIRHEQCHIMRGDHLVKPFAYFVVILHWFNPMVWIAFHYMCKDMEMSCDEKVIRSTGNAIKKEYCMSLLSFATAKQPGGLSPLAFGETSVKTRIKNVMKFKKPKGGVLVVVAFLCILFVVSCISNPEVGNNILNIPVNSASVKELKMKKDKDGISDFAKVLYKNRNPYIGNPSANGKLLSILEVSKEFGNYTIALETKNRPYVLKINLLTEQLKKPETVDKMQEYSSYLLALIENADEIHWGTSSNGENETKMTTYIFSVGSFQETELKNIKEFGSSEHKIQELIKYLQ